jgi:flagella basal body P-ring formation protein FlgA
MLRFSLSAVFLFSGIFLAHAQKSPNRSMDDHIRRSAVDQLLRQYDLSESRIEVRVDRLETVLKTARNIRLKFTDRWETPRGRVQADILVEEEGNRWTNRGWTRLYVSHYDSVIISRETLRPDDELTREHVKTVRVDVTQLRNQPLTDNEFRNRCMDEPCYLRRYVQEGDIVRENAVRHRYAAQAGDMIKMTYQRRGISASLRCRTRQSGFVGDTVRVACSSTRSIYRVRLTREGAAEWQETL